MRDYDPTTGSTLQPDPLGLVDGPNVYRYASANPMRYTDPKGLFDSRSWPGPKRFERVTPFEGGAGGIGGGFGGGRKLTIGRAIGGIIGLMLGGDTPYVSPAEPYLPDSIDGVDEPDTDCNNCPPCRPYQKGDVVYGWGTGHTHYPYGDPHINYWVILQDPVSCKCHYSKPFYANPPPMPQWKILPYNPKPRRGKKYILPKLSP